MEETKKIKIIIFGANGQLGQEFRYISNQFDQFDFSFYGKSDVDITLESSIKEAIYPALPDYVINCAAYTAVDKAETEKEPCFAINSNACAAISNILKDTKTKLVHFSSDYVYHTYKGFPIKESDEKSPQSIYATSKLLGENIIRSSGVQAMIIRTSWVVSSYGHNFVKTMKKLGAERNQINVVNDQYGAPTYARHLAKTVLEIINNIAKDQELEKYFNDTYNYANEGLVTWYDLASQVMKIADLPCQVFPIPTTDYPTPATRPPWSVLSKQKIKNNFRIAIPHWHSALKECMAAMK